MATDFQLFLYTVDEYKRFANYLPVKQFDSLSGDYSEADYVGIQVRLMLLRKYYGSNIKENVNFKKLTLEAQNAFPHAAYEFQALSTEFDAIETQQMEHLLADGTKLNIYTTIEDSVYGLYLHADQSRIARLENTTEAIRFFCTRKYICEVEAIIFKLYDLLIANGVMPQMKSEPSRSPALYLGDTQTHTQSVKMSPYWSNLYGRDATNGAIETIAREVTLEERGIIDLCRAFIDELKKDSLDVKELRKYVHPLVRRDWGDFSKAKAFFFSIPNPGFSTKVRYNEGKDTAYVRIFPKVEEAFYIETPHVLGEVYEFALGKWLGKWMIYSFGGHLDSIYEKRKSND